MPAGPAPDTMRPMLVSVRIKNLALVTDLSLELEPGLNVITGETGAGKSVILGALNLVLGQRADRGLIRAGEDACIVEAVFDVTRLRAPLKGFLDENGLEPCEEHQLVVKRSFSASGTNRQFVNGSPTNLSTLSALGAWLVDMHGPHDHQSLLHPSRQLAMLDAFGGLDASRERFSELGRQLKALQAEADALVVDERTYAQQLDLLRFQVQEIQQAQLKADEDEPLQDELQRVSNVSRLMELSRGAQELLSEGDPSLILQAGQLGRTLQELLRLDPSAKDIQEAHAQMVSLLQDLSQSVSHYADRLESDPGRLAELEERLGLIQSLKRKYGGTLSEVIQFGVEAADRLNRLEGREGELLRIRGQMSDVQAKLWKAGQELSQQRAKVAPKLSRDVSRQLQELGFKQSQFEVRLRTQTQAEFGQALRASGVDEIEFQFAPNPGEPSQPLRAIASSGEMARVMLAIKTVLATQDEVPVLVFDEVDANVGGETAQVVGQKMAQIAKQRQVLCITHLAPVAASASTHYVVSKQIKNGRTSSEIDKLSKADRVTEIARMLGGQSSAARKHAEELLG